MSGRTASVLSIDAVRLLKLALDEFANEIEEGLTMLDLECNRPLEWIEHDRAQYWPRELRKASDRLSEARQALARCEMTGASDERRSCYEERALLEKAKRRLRLCEEKVEIVRRWKPKLRKEIEEFRVQVARLRNFLENDVPRAGAVLERMATALDRYVELTGPVASDSGEGVARLAGAFAAALASAANPTADDAADDQASAAAAIECHSQEKIASGGSANETSANQNDSIQNDSNQNDSNQNDSNQNESSGHGANASERGESGSGEERGAASSGSSKVTAGRNAS